MLSIIRGAGLRDLGSPMASGARTAGRIGVPKAEAMIQARCHGESDGPGGSTHWFSVRGLYPVGAWWRILAGFGGLVEDQARLCEATALASPHVGEKVNAMRIHWSSHRDVWGC